MHPALVPRELAARRRQRREERGLRAELCARPVDVLRRRRRHAADGDGRGLRHDRDRPQHLRARGRVGAQPSARASPARPRKMLPLDDIRTQYYLRFGVLDQPGVCNYITKEV